MAKISTYPSDGNPSLSDRLIGSDAENSNATKNYSIYNVLNVIGDYYADAGTGPAGYLLTSNGSGNAPTWEANPLGGYVPYNGATDNVFLGPYGLEAQDLFGNVVGGGDIYANNSLHVQAGAPIYLAGNTGNGGDVMVSGGATNNPVWQTQSTLFSGFVPYTGATSDVDLDTYDLFANNINGNNVNGNEVSGDFVYANDFYEDNNKLTSYVQAFSINTQTQTSVSTAKLIEFETGSFSDTATIASNLITFNAIGKYMVEVTARVEHVSGGGDAVLNFWLQNSVTGPITYSRQTFTVANAHTQEIRYTFLVNATSASDAIRAYWSTSNLAARFSPTVAGGIYPSAPSTMLNVYKIG